MSVVSKRFNWNSACILSDHYHLLIETVDGNLAGGMPHLRSFPSAAAVYYCMALCLFLEAAYADLFEVGRLKKQANPKKRNPGIPPNLLACRT